MIYPSTFEHKVGFDSLRTLLKGACSTIPARDMVDALAFHSRHADVMALLEPVAEMLAIISGDGGALPLPELPDLAPVVAALGVDGAVLSVDDIVGLRLMMQTAEELKRYFAAWTDDAGNNSAASRLVSIASALETYPDLRRAVDRTVDRYGNVLDSASLELADIRKRLRAASGTVNTIMRRVMARAVAEGLVDADASPAMRDGRLVIPVAPANKRRLGGIVHDESASGRTVYIEPSEVVEASNRQRELELEERREIGRIMAELTRTLRPEAYSLAATYHDIATLDFIRAKARLARDTRASMPRVADGPDLEWFNARHPGLEASLKRHGREIVPLDIRLTAEKRILLISGPNAGGKSVCLKTTGCLQYMLQCGLLPPADDNSCFGVFDDIFIDIGDDQSIDDDLSTYSSHLRNMRRFLTSSRPTSLVLIDEMGSGTEPQLGGAIAQAILQRLNETEVWGIVTTHFHNLKLMASETPGLVNGSMLYDRGRMQPTFRLSVGNPGSSFALEIARNTGLPADVIDRAKDIAGSDYVNLDKYLLDIARDRRYWENKRNTIHRRERELEDTLQRYRDEAETLRHARREILDEARREAKNIVDSSNAAIERTISDIRSAQAEREATLKARRELRRTRDSLASNVNEPRKDSHPLLRKAPKARGQKGSGHTKVDEKKEIGVGDIVKLDGQNTPGRVMAIEGKKATVSFGALKTSVSLSRLTPTNAKLPTPAAADKASSYISRQTAEDIRRRQLSFKPEIDVRGMRADEALQAVTYFIDDAIQFSQGRVRILHGTGTGALRVAIRQLLATRPGVRSAVDEDVRLGGAGVTVVNLD